MADETHKAQFINSLTRIVTLVSIGLAAFATWKTLPVDEEIKKLQAETQRLDLALKRADAELKTLESDRKVAFDLYKEVKSVIEKEGADPREEHAVRVLVEVLADDPFRYKLLKVIAVGAKSKDVKETAAATSKFYEEESTLQTRIQSIAPVVTRKVSPLNGVGTFNVDFFYCETKRVTSEPLARALLATKTTADRGRWRVRALPESINRQSGYGISVSEIRFTPPHEKHVAIALAKILASKGIEVQFRETTYPTPGYVSVFICQ